MEEPTTFTKEERDLLLDMFGNIKVAVMMDDAPLYCERLQSIAAKVKRLTEQGEDTEQ